MAQATSAAKPKRAKRQEARDDRIVALEKRVAEMERQLALLVGAEVSPADSEYYRRLHQEIADEVAASGAGHRLTREESLARLKHTVRVSPEVVDRVLKEDDEF